MASAAGMEGVLAMLHDKALPSGEGNSSSQNEVSCDLGCPRGTRKKETKLEVVPSYC